MSQFPARSVPEPFWEDLGRAAQRILLLDYDGTLAPFTVNRFEAVPYAGVPDVLNAISRAGHTRLVLISGRDLEELFNLLQLDRRPEAYGSHGIEHYLPDGRRETAALDEPTRLALHEAEQSLRAAGLAGKLECKVGCVVLHWRGESTKTSHEMRDLAISAWNPLKTDRLVIRDFDAGIEIRYAGVNKGSAVNQVLATSGSDSVTAYLGDDLTDEDAFAALHGRGLSILVRPELRATSADVWLQPPDELLDFLERWHLTAAQ